MLLLAHPANKCKKLLKLDEKAKKQIQIKSFLQSPQIWIVIQMLYTDRHVEHGLRLRFNREIPQGQ